MTSLVLVDVHGPGGGLRILGHPSRSASPLGVEREARHPTPPRVPGSFPTDAATSDNPTTA